MERLPDEVFFGRKSPDFRHLTKRLANPMYGVGNLHSYCPALLTGSLFGLWFALGCHLSIYAFYFFVERPFIRRTYQHA